MTLRALVAYPGTRPRALPPTALAALPLAELLANLYVFRKREDMSEKAGKKQQKVSAKQRAERIKAAEERQARAKAAEERAAKTKKIFTVVVCVVLVLALGLPTMALAVLGG